MSAASATTQAATSASWSLMSPFMCSSVAACFFLALFLFCFCHSTLASEAKGGFFRHLRSLSCGGIQSSPPPVRVNPPERKDTKSGCGGTANTSATTATTTTTTVKTRPLSEPLSAASNRQSKHASYPGGASVNRSSGGSSGGPLFSAAMHTVKAAAISVPHCPPSLFPTPAQKQSSVSAVLSSASNVSGPIMAPSLELSTVKRNVQSTAGSSTKADTNTSPLSPVNIHLESKSETDESIECWAAPVLFPEFQPANRKQLLALVACVLEKIMQHRKNDRLPSDTKLITAFHSVSVPSMTIQAYFTRLVDFIGFSAESAFVALVYMERLYRTQPDVAIDSLTIHRLLLTSMMCAAKFLDDNVYNNAMWANVGGVAIKEVNALERELLALLDYSTFVTAEEFAQEYTDLTHPALHVACACQNKCFFNTQHYPLSTAALQSTQQCQRRYIDSKLFLAAGKLEALKIKPAVHQTSSSTDAHVAEPFAHLPCDCDLCRAPKSPVTPLPSIPTWKAHATNAHTNANINTNANASLKLSPASTPTPAANLFTATLTSQSGSAEDVNMTPAIVRSTAAVTVSALQVVAVPVSSSSGSSASSTTGVRLPTIFNSSSSSSSIPSTKSTVLQAAVPMDISQTPHLQPQREHGARTYAHVAMTIIPSVTSLKSPPKSMTHVDTRNLHFFPPLHQGGALNKRTTLPDMGRMLMSDTCACNHSSQDSIMSRVRSMEVECY